MKNMRSESVTILAALDWRSMLSLVPNTNLTTVLSRSKTMYIDIYIPVHVYIFSCIVYTIVSMLQTILGAL